MSDSKHTPQPWGQSGYEDQFGSGQMLAGNNGKGKYVCHVYTDVNATHSQTTVKWQENRWANLRLIASAPALLELLREAELQIEFSFSETGRGNSLLTRIRAAIAKAEGKS